MVAGLLGCSCEPTFCGCFRYGEIAVAGVVEEKGWEQEGRWREKDLMALDVGRTGIILLAMACEYSGQTGT